MRIVATFVPNLYAFHFSDKEFDALESTFDDWENPLFLLEFFTDNQADLKGAYTIEEAIVKTRQEVKKFRKKMLGLANTKPHNLNQFFANLYNNEYKVSLLQRQKAKQNWLRLYALKITQEEKEDLYVITGGMIKLTHNMEDRNHGELERDKINQCRDYLKTIGVYDIDSLFETYF
jgi:hypothetical protein